MKQPKATAKNHNVGDTLTIRNKLYGHGFKVNQKVEISRVVVEDYWAKDNNGQGWWVADANFMTRSELNSLIRFDKGVGR
jgi:hypothetical protein